MNDFCNAGVSLYSHKTSTRHTLLALMKPWQKRKKTKQQREQERETKSTGYVYGMNSRIHSYPET